MTKSQKLLRSLLTFGHFWCIPLYRLKNDYSSELEMGGCYDTICKEVSTSSKIHRLPGFHFTDSINDRNREDKDQL